MFFKKEDKGMEGKERREGKLQIGPALGASCLWSVY